MAETLLKKFINPAGNTRIEPTTLRNFRRAKTSRTNMAQRLTHCKRGTQIPETQQPIISKIEEYKPKTVSEELEIKNKTIRKLERELKITLHNLLCTTDGVLDCWDAIDDAKRKASVQHIMDARDRLMLLFRNVSDLAEFRDGKFELKCQYTDIKALTVGIINDFKSLSGFISLHIAGGTNTKVYCDKSRIQQVMRNLITNAIRYAGADKPIQISISSETNHTRVAVADEGQGIATNLSERIFDHSYKNSDHKYRVGGADMGIAICREIIISHKGRMWAETNSKGGATFCFTLPYQENTL